MAVDPRTTETPTVRENKSSAFRWAVGLVAVLALGVTAWMATDHRGEPIDPTPQHQSGVELEGGTSQPAAVTPNQDAGTGAPAASPPAGDATGTNTQ